MAFDDRFTTSPTQAIASEHALAADCDQAVVREIRQPDQAERQRQDAQARHSGRVGAALRRPRRSAAANRIIIVSRLMPNIVRTSCDTLVQAPELGSLRPPRDTATAAGRRTR